MLPSTQWVANTRWAAGVVTALGVALITPTIVGVGAPVAHSAFFILETRAGQISIVSSALVWAALVIYEDFISAS